MIPYGKQSITEKDIDAVVEVLRSDFITQGQTVPAFENAVADYCGAGFGVAVNSATSALHIACLALGLGEGDWLWTTPNTFVASANCGLYCRASVDFVDISSETLNMCPEALHAKLQVAEREGRLPKVIIPVHFAGRPCDMKRIHELSRQYGFSVIEDASHAIGAASGSAKVGACEYSDITVFSFHPVKIITTGEGGVATTNSAELAGRMALFRSHGITKDADLMTGGSHPEWYYQQQELGFNYRLTDIQAALGVSQMSCLDDNITVRHQLNERYLDLFSDVDVQCSPAVTAGRSALHLFPVRYPSAEQRLKAFRYLRSQGIGVNVHYIPVHLQPFYRAMGFTHGDFPAAESYYSVAMSLPMYATLSFEEQDIVVDRVKKSLLV